MRALLLGLALSISTYASDNFFCKDLLGLPDAIRSASAIPDSQEWHWYGTPMAKDDVTRLTRFFQLAGQGNEHEITDLFAQLALNPSQTTIQYYKHPHYTELMSFLLDTLVQDERSHEDPDDEDVNRAYNNAIELRTQRYAIGFDKELDRDGICEAAADAAGYFYWRDKFGYVAKYLSIMEQMQCPDDFTSFETGRPMPPLPPYVIER